jgi:hypothetical protein
MFSPVKLNVELTKEVFGYAPDDLHPGSHQKVVVECLGCHRLIHRERRNIHAVHQCPVLDGDKKKCFRCMQWKDISLFNKSPKGSGGVSKMCRECYNSHPSVKQAENNRKARIRRAVSSGDIEYYVRFRINCLRNHAKRKGIAFDLDFDFMYRLWQEQAGLCYYIGLPMTGSMKQNGFQAWDSPSVDRKEPSLGYIKGNVVWCTFAANSFKQSLNETQFADAVKNAKWWYDTGNK